MVRRSSILSANAGNSGEKWGEIEEDEQVCVYFLTFFMRAFPHPFIFEWLE